MYYRSGTDRRFVFTHLQVTALCCVKWRHDRHIESVTSHRKSDSVNRCAFSEDQTCQKIHSDPIRSHGARTLGVFWKRSQPKEKEQDGWMKYEISSWSNKYECTTDQLLVLARRFVFTYQVAPVFCVKWRHDRHLETVTLNRKPDSVNPCVFTRGTILPHFIPIRFETACFWRDRPNNNNNNNNNKMSSDMRSVPDLQIAAMAERPCFLYKLCVVMRLLLLVVCSVDGTRLPLRTWPMSCSRDWYCCMVSICPVVLVNVLRRRSSFITRRRDFTHLQTPYYKRHSDVELLLNSHMIMENALLK